MPKVKMYSEMQQREMQPDISYDSRTNEVTVAFASYHYSPNEAEILANELPIKLRTAADKARDVDKTLREYDVKK